MKGTHVKLMFAGKSMGIWREFRIQEKLSHDSHMTLKEQWYLTLLTFGKGFLLSCHPNCGLEPHGPTACMLILTNIFGKVYSGRRPASATGH